MVKKPYYAPAVHSEQVVLGVFGTYGLSVKHSAASFPKKAKWNFFTWLFSWL
jgi:hypothetical protein